MASTMSLAAVLVNWPRWSGATARVTFFTFTGRWIHPNPTNQRQRMRGASLRAEGISPSLQRHDKILDELRQRQKQCEINSEYLFCIPNGEHMVPEAYERFVKNAFATAGVIGKTSYTFRRTVNNRMEEAGFTPSERAFLLGHTPETNIRFYTNPRKNAVLKKFEERFCTGLPEKYNFYTTKNPWNAYVSRILCKMIERCEPDLKNRPHRKIQ